VTSERRPPPGIGLKGPVILLVLAATAVPIELRAPGRLGFSIQPVDVLSNVAGYIPVGLVLCELGPLTAILAAATVAIAAEAAQFFMVYRDPSPVDVVANVIGAGIGTIICTRWRLGTLRVRPGKREAFAAAATALAVAIAIVTAAGGPINPRGSSEQGTIEGHWRFDEREGRIAGDSSGHGLSGTLRGDPVRVGGVREGALALDGADDYIDFGHPSALRLVGDLTVSAWINVRANPADDAAIVSSIRHVGTASGEGFGVGFQLDTTVDTGPRTIGFKVNDACGRLVARYGATPLQLDTWYHVAGAYDGTARTLDVYLNGRLDSGVLRGAVPGLRRTSREPLYVARRTDLAGFEFAGSLDDVRVYSRAVPQDELIAQMRSAADDSPAARVRSAAPATKPDLAALECTWTSEREDARLPGAVAALGALIAIACLGWWSRAAAVLALAFSCGAGLLLVHALTPTLPRMNLWLIPLICLAGGVSVVVSRRTAAPDHARGRSGDESG